MGYEFNFDGSLTVPPEHLSDAIDAVMTLPVFVNTQRPDNLDELIGDVLGSGREAICYGDENTGEIAICGASKLRDQTDALRVLAGFGVGEIHCHGDEDSQWVWLLTNGQFYEENAVVTYPVTESIPRGIMPTSWNTYSQDQAYGPGQ